jgi:phosphoribosyl-dephospho-CoA transferase
MLSLRRHQLVTLKPDAWPLLLSMAGDDVARVGLAHWAKNDLPLVVARRSEGESPLTQQLGLPLPLRWGSRRLSLGALPTQVAQVDEFPAASAALPLWGAVHLGDWQRLICQLADQGVRTQVYGSYGWQALTGLGYLHAGSDLDLLMHVPDAPTADMATSLLANFAVNSPRLDGELVFGSDTAVAWREWKPWRCGRSAAILLKRTSGVALETGTRWLADLSTQGASGRA